MNEDVFAVVGVSLVALGSAFCLAAAIGLVRFPDALARMHAATKPAVFGLLLVLSGVGVALRDPAVIALMALAVLLQVMTAPVSGHLVSRQAHRLGQWDSKNAVIDELSADAQADVD